MEHIHLSVLNFLTIGVSAFVFLWGGAYVATFLAGRSIPMLSPIAGAVLGVFKQLP